MKKLKVYLDTSIINFLYETDSPDLKKVTEVFFEEIVAKEKIDVFVSNIVIDEINQTENDNKREILLKTFEKHKNIKTLVAGKEEIDEIGLLAEKYIENGIIPAKKAADSLHVAFATLFQMDVLLSWNYKHLANINKEQKIIILNKTLGYNYPFRMTNPLEVYFGE